VQAQMEAALGEGEDDYGFRLTVKLCMAKLFGRLV